MQKGKRHRLRQHQQEQQSLSKHVGGTHKRCSSHTDVATPPGVKSNYDPAMRFVAYAEVAIFAWVLFGALLFRNSLLAPLFYAHFLRLRFYMSSFTRAAFQHVGAVLDGYTQHPSCPPAVRRAYLMVTDLVRIGRPGCARCDHVLIIPFAATDFSLCKYGPLDAEPGTGWCRSYRGGRHGATSVGVHDALFTTQRQLACSFPEQAWLVPYVSFSSCHGGKGTLRGLVLDRGNEQTRPFSSPALPWWTVSLWHPFLSLYTCQLLPYESEPGSVKRRVYKDEGRAFATRHDDALPKPCVGKSGCKL